MSEWQDCALGDFANVKVPKLSGIKIASVGMLLFCGNGLAVMGSE